MKLFVSTSPWWPVLLVVLVACQKQVGNPNNGNPIGAIRLSYSDSIFYLRSTAAANLINPTTRPTAPGYFMAIPKGLSIDSATGRINLAASETGIRYKVYYVPTGSNRATDSVRLVVSGVDYEDRIYSIEATPSVADTAFPIYNANPSLRPICNEDDDDDDDDDGCMFDETDLNEDGNDDIAGVVQDKLLVNKGIGTIDLEASFNAGLFGGQSPANGTERVFTMYYRLNDASLRALNKIDIRVIFYERRADIPLSLLNELNRRRTSRVLGREVITPGVTGAAQRRVELRTLVDLIRTERAREKRPPMIILTRNL